jgi:hypothetical protein
LTRQGIHVSFLLEKFHMSCEFFQFKIKINSLSPDGILLPTSSDHAVDSDNIFVVGVAVVILHTHLCISCRCMLNKTKNELNQAWFMLLYRQNSFHKTHINGNSETKTRWNRFETL